MKVDQLHYSPLEDATERQARVAAYANGYTELGAGIQDMPPFVTAMMAEYGVYTTTEPEGYYDFSSFRAGLAHQRGLDKIADNLETRMGSYSRYSTLVALGHTGRYLAQVFGNINSIHADNVHIERPTLDGDTMVDGNVVADRVVFGVQSVEAGARLNDALQMIGHREQGPFITHARGLTVEAMDVSEHSVRSIERVVGALVAREDLRQTGMRLPASKDRLSGWKKEGKTFPPEVEARLREHTDAYAVLRGAISADYKDGPTLRPVLHKDILGTSTAPAFQGMRAIMNGVITTQFSKGSGRNPEQDPIVSNRPSIEKGVELRRDNGDRQAEASPPSSRALTLNEQLAEAGRKRLETVQHNPVQESLRTLGKIAGVGASTLLEISAELGPGARKSLAQYFKDRAAWREYRAELAASDARIASVIRDINARVVLSRDKS